MNKIIAISLFMFGCGRPLKQVNSDELHNIVARGPVASRETSQLETSLQLASANTKIYQMYRFANSDVVHKILFDTSMVEVETGNPELVCLEQIRTHQNLLAPITLGNLELARTQQIGKGLVQVSLQRLENQEKVRNASVECLFSRSEDGLKLQKITNNSSFHAPLETGDALDSTDIRFILGEGGGILGEIKQSWLARPEAVYQTSEFEYQKGREMFKLTIANATGEILEGSTKNLAFRQTLTGSVYHRSYLEENHFQQSLPLTPIITSEGTVVSSTDGFFQSSASIQGVKLESERVVVYGEDAAQPMVIDHVDHGDHGVDVSDPDSNHAGLNSFASIHRINKFARQYLSPQDVPFLDKAIDVRVNQSGECNAFYTTGRAVISLFRAGGGCANVATVNDVIYHEWGHALDDHTGRVQGVTDGAFSEGIGDIVSAFFNQDPTIGVGFVQDENYGIRRIDKVKVYPRDTGEVHREGGIIAGAFWRLNASFQERYGKAKGQDLAASYFFKHLLFTDSYLESYDSLLILDDDDNNPATRSPNFCLITEVFAAHGLAAPVNCEDDAPQTFEADTSLTLALYDIGPEQVGAVGSGQGIGEFYLCMGSQKTCLQDDRIHLKLPLLSRNDERTFFAYKGALPLQGVDVVTLISKDVNGQVTGSRLVKIFTK